jgi:rhodanese-related sulfurtransferase
MTRFVLIPVLALSLAAFIATAMAAEKANYEFPNISIDDLKSAIADKKVTLIDANGSESWKEAHIPGALDFESSKEKLATVLPKEKDALIVAYCGGPQCMAYKSAAKAAKELGYTNVRHLSAGISGWQQAKEQTEKGS